jgi:putative transposase
VCCAMEIAIAQRQPPQGLIAHSDRGSQYATAIYRALLARDSMQQSMSRKGNCWDKAVMERFVLSLKIERVWRRNYAHPGGGLGVTKRAAALEIKVSATEVYERTMASKPLIEVSGIS